MVSSPLLSLPDGLGVDEVRVLYECVTICVRSTATLAKCPLCSQLATRIHRRYLRTVADLPSGGETIQKWVLAMQLSLLKCKLHSERIETSAPIFERSLLP